MRRAARYLAISSKKSRCALKKKESRGANYVDVEPRLDTGLDVGKAIRQRERELLDGGRAGFPDMIAADADRIPFRNVVGAERENIGDEPHRRLRRKDPRLLRDVFLENIVLYRPAHLVETSALLLARAQIEGEKYRGRGVDRHRGRDLRWIDPVEQDLHVAERIDRDPAPSDLPLGAGMVGVVAHDRGHVECDAQTRLAVIEEIMVSPVRIARGPESGKLPHRPEPPAVHRRIDAPREGIFAGKSEVAQVIEPGGVLLRVERLYRLRRNRREVDFLDRLPREGTFPARPRFFEPRCLFLLHANLSHLSSTTRPAAASSFPRKAPRAPGRAGRGTCDPRTLPPS